MWPKDRLQLATYLPTDALSMTPVDTVGIAPLIGLRPTAIKRRAAVVG